MSYTKYNFDKETLEAILTLKKALDFHNSFRLTPLSWTEFQNLTVGGSVLKAHMTLGNWFLKNKEHIKEANNGKELTYWDLGKEIFDGNN